MEDIKIKRSDDIATVHHMMVAKNEIESKKELGSLRSSTAEVYYSLCRDPSKLNESSIAHRDKFQILQDVLREETTMKDDTKVSEVETTWPHEAPF